MCAFALVVPALALAVPPEPGQFKGSFAIPRFESKTQDLQFAVSGNGRRIFAFDIPSCTDAQGRPLFALRTVRPRVSETGRIRGRLVYEKEGANNTLRKYSVRVSGGFVTRSRARGRAAVTVTVYRVSADAPPRQIGEPCRASGTWKARHE